MICKECYSEHKRITPLLNPIKCLENHTQYICGLCGRCICIEETKHKLQRWNFPFKSIETAKLYLRVADFTMKKCCGIYEIKTSKDKTIYKILSGQEELYFFLKKNPNKICEKEYPIFSMNKYNEFSNTEIRKLTSTEAKKYLSER